jgi:integrase/recombinase XerD
MSANVALTSPLGPVITRFITLKQALGRHYDGERRLLRQLDGFLASLAPVGADLTAETFSLWCQTLSPLCAATRRHRMAVVDQLCRYRRRTEPTCFVPDTTLFPRISQPVRPYLFTLPDIARLLGAADALTPTPRSPLRAADLRLGIVLLYTAGLRRGELLRLQLGDVDRVERTLWIRASKFNKPRLLPLSQDAFTEVERHRHVRRASPLPNDSSAPVLCHRPSSHQLGYTGKGLRDGICALLQTTGIRTSTGRLPRIHDFRHSFALRALQRWYESGADVQAKLPLLSLYMGHVSIASTEYYLPFVTDLATTASERFERYGSALMTGVPTHRGGEQ